MLFFMFMGRLKHLRDKEILMCVIIVNLHIVIMIIIVDYIPAMVLLWGLQEEQERVYYFDGMDVDSLHMLWVNAQ